MNTALSNPTATTNLIIVMGVSGSGKSTIAQALAQHYQYTYLDADDFHSDASRALMAQGIPLTDEQRAPWVAAIKQELERKAEASEACVLAFSGLKQKHRNELRRAGLRTLFLFLNGSQDVIQDRINKREGHFMAPQLLTSQFDSLENPLDETDVQSINSNTGVANVIAESIDVIARILRVK